MLQKILAVFAACVVVVALVLAWQLDTARSEVSTLTSARDAAKQEAANAKQAQLVAEAQNALLAGAFKALDTRLVQLGVDQKANNDRLALQIQGLGNIQKTEGDQNGAFECLDIRLPAQLDQWLYDAPAGANGGH